MLIDLHVHTTKGSADSSLTPAQLVAEAARLGLDAVCLTEHSGVWEHRELECLAGETGVRVFSGIEVATDMGHVLVIGGSGYASGMHRLKTLRGYASKTGALLVLAHPFRYFREPAAGRKWLLSTPGAPAPLTAREAAAHAAFSLVDAVEAVNGATAEGENRMAADAAMWLGLPATGGSDAHSRHGIASGVTEVRGEPRNEAELAEAVRSGHARAGSGFNAGAPRWATPPRRRSR